LSERTTQKKAAIKRPFSFGVRLLLLPEAYSFRFDLRLVLMLEHGKYLFADHLSLIKEMAELLPK